ncbi:MAG: TolC family protein [Candidatus Omnitrophica bacterium]|nr:TolC family protein [Candidatus Omnitrophota bacterium]
MSYNHNFKFYSFIVSLSLLLGPGASLAAETAVYASKQALESAADRPLKTSAVHLDELIQILRQRNPEMIAAKAEWLAAKKRVWIDSSLPDPMAGYDIMGGMRETRTGPEEQRFMVSQEVPFPSKLWEKGKAAQDEAKAAYQRYRAIERDLINELKKSYYELYFIDASLEVIDEVKGILKKFENVAQARYSNLTGTQRDVAKAQAEVSMTLEKLFMLQQERESVSAKINSLLDQDPMTEIGKAVLPEKPVLPNTLIELVNLAVQNRQEIKEMEALVSKARHGKKLAWMENIPNVTVGFEYTKVGSGDTTDPMDGDDQWMFPLRINIPLWLNKNIPQIQEAQKIVEANQAKLTAAKNTTYYEVKDAYFRYDSATKIAELYDTAVIPQAKLALTSDQAGYESGKTDFLNLLDSERVYLNAKLTHVRLLTTALASHSDLVRATGIDLEGESHE